MVVECLTHGPMKERFALDWWECPGFDGEGCEVQIVYAEDVTLGEDSGIPGVKVIPDRPHTGQPGL